MSQRNFPSKHQPVGKKWSELRNELRGIDNLIERRRMAKTLYQVTDVGVDGVVDSSSSLSSDKKNLIEASPTGNNGSVITRPVFLINVN